MVSCLAHLDRRLCGSAFRVAHADGVAATGQRPPQLPVTRVVSDGCAIDEPLERAWRAAARDERQRLELRPQCGVDEEQRARKRFDDGEAARGVARTKGCGSWYLGA